MKKKEILPLTTHNHQVQIKRQLEDIIVTSNLIKKVDNLSVRTWSRVMDNPQGPKMQLFLTAHFIVAKKVVKRFSHKII